TRAGDRGRPGGGRADGISPLCAQPVAAGGAGAGAVTAQWHHLPCGGTAAGGAQCGVADAGGAAAGSAVVVRGGGWGRVRSKAAHPTKRTGPPGRVCSFAAHHPEPHHKSVRSFQISGNSTTSSILRR